MKTTIALSAAALMALTAPAFASAHVATDKVPTDALNVVIGTEGNTVATEKLTSGPAADKKANAIQKGNDRN